MLHASIATILAEQAWAGGKQRVLLSDIPVQHSRRQDGGDGPRVAAVAVQQARVLTEARSLQAADMAVYRRQAR